MSGMVPALSIVMMAVSGVCSVTIPILLFVHFRKKGADIVPFFVGCGVMFVFAFVLEAIVHNIVLGSPAGEAIINNIYLYALYGGLMAGLFEETGRYVAFRTVLKKYREKNVNALMYGAGHGGFEAVVILGITMVLNIALSVMINTGMIDTVFGMIPAESLEAFKLQLDGLVTTAPAVYLLGVVERILAIILHIALSVLVWFSVKSRKTALFPLAILLHAIVDGVTVTIARSGIPGAAIISEAAIAVFVAIIAFMALKVWKKSEETA